jgi:hypothetical protein
MTKVDLIPSPNTKYENQGKEHEVCNISSNVTLLQKCENNIT